MYIHQRALWSVLEWQCAALTCAILKADRKPDWIWPRCTTPVTPTTSSIPSQWLGFENWSSFSGPQGLAPEPQLQNSHVSLTIPMFRNFVEPRVLCINKKSRVQLHTKMLYHLHRCIPASPTYIHQLLGMPLPTPHTHTHTHTQTRWLTMWANRSRTLWTLLLI